MSTSFIVAVLQDGRRVNIAVHNHGWDGENFYTTEFCFDGVDASSQFRSTFHQPTICPDPALRLARDEEVLEEALRAHFGVGLEDIELCD